MTCVFCDKSDSLNTSLTLTLDDGTKVSVLICDTHAENATIKTTKAAYLKKQKKIAIIMEKAKALGLNITDVQQQGKLLVSTVENQPTKQLIQQPINDQQIIPNQDDPDEVSTDKIDRPGGIISVGGTGNVQGQSVSVSANRSHDLSSLESKLPEEARKGKAKMVVVEGREGQPLAIPEKRTDGLGTTVLKITKKEDDARLQTRFKKMATDSIHHDRTPDFARAGYQNTQVECPICRGECNIKQNVGGIVKDTTCPKCNGTGTISVY